MNLLAVKVNVSQMIEVEKGLGSGIHDVLMSSLRNLNLD